MSTAINEDMHKVLRRIEQASAATKRGDWAKAERALIEAQERIGRLLREIGLKQSSVVSTSR